MEGIIKIRMGRIIKGRMEGKRIRGRPRWMVLDRMMVDRYRKQRSIEKSK